MASHALTWSACACRDRRRSSPPNEKETHASKHDVALGRLSFKQRPIVEGSKDSLDADRCEQGDFGGIANEGGDLRVGRSTVLEKTLEDSAADVT